MKKQFPVCCPRGPEEIGFVCVLRVLLVPLTYSKRATSLHLEECGNRLSRSCISILPNVHIQSRPTCTLLHTQYTPVHSHMKRTRVRTYTCDFERKPRTNDIASYNTRASNITGAILPPAEINVSSQLSRLFHCDCGQVSSFAET